MVHSVMEAPESQGVAVGPSPWLQAPPSPRPSPPPHTPLLFEGMAQCDENAYTVRAHKAANKNFGASITAPRRELLK